MPFDIRALERSGDGDDRWSDGRLPTAYLAADPLTAIAEFVRHGDPDDPVHREIVRMELAPTRILDLRRPEVQSVIGPRAAPAAALDRSTAQRLGSELRALGVAQGLIVPSMAFLDRPDRFNIVLFVEVLEGGISGALGSPTVAGSVRVEA